MRLLASRNLQNAMLKLIKAIQEIDIYFGEEQDIQEIADEIYLKMTDWFGLPEDMNWPYYIAAASFVGCTSSRLTKSYTIFLNSAFLEKEFLIESLAHEMYHRFTIRKQTLRKLLWVDETLAFLCSQHFLVECDFEQRTLQTRRIILSQPKKVDFAFLKAARSRRVLFGLKGIEYPDGFGFMISKLAFALDILLDWNDICALATAPNFDAWYATLEDEDRLISQALFASMDASSSPEFDKAIRQLLAASSDFCNTDYLDHCLKLARAYRMIGHYNSSLFLIEQMAHICPDHSEILNSMAIALDKLDNIPAAIEVLHRSLALEPDDTQARHNYATFLYKQGHRQEAHTQWKILADNEDAETSRKAQEVLDKFQ